MADDQLEVKRVNWQEAFSFTHIFKCFGMAIHPSKILLALAAIVLVYAFGCLLDGFWALGGRYVAPGEIFSHYALRSAQFQELQKARPEKQLQDAADLLATARRERRNLDVFQSRLREVGQSQALLTSFTNKLLDVNRGESAFTDQSVSTIVEEAKKADTSWSKLLGEAEDVFAEEMDKAGSVLKAAAKDAQGAAKEKPEKEALQKHLAAARRATTLRKVEFRQKVEAVRGQTIFAGLLDYELQCLGNAIGAVRHGNLFGGLAAYRQQRAAAGLPDLERPVPALPAEVQTPSPAEVHPGFLYWGLLGYHAILWLFCQHWLYAVIFGLFVLAVCALIGGAVHRIAAVQFAREEKISIVQAMRFSVGKFPSFFTAPLIPLAVIFFLAVPLILGGLVASIPYAGELLLGVTFFLALGCGAIIAFLLLGLVSGGLLMYPTIAVEGSDSFDAVSRSYSYVFNHPWRAVLYGLVGLFYGVVTYLFVRVFVYLALAATHLFTGWGVLGGGAALDPQADKLDVMWAAPTFERLFGPFPWAAMNGTQAVGAFLLGIWVFLLAAVVGAYLLSFLGCGSTVIYYLLRRKADATDLDDVYLEEATESAESLAEAPAPAEGAAAEKEKKKD